MMTVWWIRDRQIIVDKDIPLSNLEGPMYLSKLDIEGSQVNYFRIVSGLNGRLWPVREAMIEFNQDFSFICPQIKSIH